MPGPVIQGGLEIIRANGGKVGTLGMLLTSDGVDRWIVSCAHVLGVGTPPILSPGERIVHPAFTAPQWFLASTSKGRIAALDCAALLLDPALDFVDEILTLGPPAQPLEPDIGMPVIKYGAATQATAGYIDEMLSDGSFRVLPNDPDEELSRGGDSGAVWLHAVTRVPLLLHLCGNDNDPEFAIGIPMLKVCDLLGLQVP